MARISDLTNWLVGVRGDEGQVRSIIKILRADGLFSSSGRGRGSPDMSADDFASAIACALSNALTTHAAHGVRELLSLKTFSVSVDRRDGAGWNEYTVWGHSDELQKIDEHDNPMLPPEMANRPKNFGDALAMWAEHFMENSIAGVMDLDEFTLRVAANSTVEIHLYNPEWSNSSWGAVEGNYQAYAWKLKFEAEDTNIDPMRRELVTKLNATQLRALAELAGSDENG